MSGKYLEWLEFVFNTFCKENFAQKKSPKFMLRASCFIVTNNGLLLGCPSFSCLSFPFFLRLIAIKGPVGPWSSEQPSTVYLQCTQSMHITFTCHGNACLQQHWKAFSMYLIIFGFMSQLFRPKLNIRHILNSYWICFCASCILQGHIAHWMQ